MVRGSSREQLAPLEAERKKPRRIEPEMIDELGELGVFGVSTSADWGGSELNPVTYALLLEEIAAGDGAISTMVLVHNSPTYIVVKTYGTAAPKDRWPRKLTTGQHVGSFSLTEAQAGSDASNLKTHALARGDRDVVSGSKQFISNASHPGSLVFFVATDSAADKNGLSAFVVEKNDPGFAVMRIVEKLGQKASDICALAFDGMEVPEDQRIGAEDEGFKIALSTLESGLDQDRHAEHRHGARRARIRCRLRPRPPGVRQRDHRLPGCRIPARRGEDPGRSAINAACYPTKGGGLRGAGGRLHGEPFCLRNCGGGVHRRDPDARRLRIPGRSSAGTDVPRSARAPDVRGHPRRVPAADALMLHHLLLGLRHPLTEDPPPFDLDLAAMATTLDQTARARLGRSLSIRQVDAGSCNGCEVEIHSLNNAFNDLERYGLRFVASPRHADVLLVNYLWRRTCGRRWNAHGEPRRIPNGWSQ